MAVHLGIAQEIDAKDYGGGAVRGFFEERLDTAESAGLDAYLAAGTEAGGIDGDGTVAIAYHADEVEHLGVGDAGKVVPARGGRAGSVHQETVDETGFAGYLIA